MDLAPNKRIQTSKKEKGIYIHCSTKLEQQLCCEALLNKGFKDVDGILTNKKYGLYIPQKTRHIFCKSCIENNPIHGIKRRIYLSALVNDTISFQSLKRGKY